MPLDEVGGYQAGGSASGTGSPIENAGSGPGSSGESAGLGSGAATTGQAAGSAAAAGLSGAARIGWGIAAGGVNGARAVGNAIKRMLMKAWTMALPGGAAISSFSGGLISTNVGTAGIFGSGVSAIVGLATFISIMTAPNAGIWGGDLEECNTAAPSKGSALFEGSKEMEESAKKIYGALSAMGMGDENIAGILGNFQVESGVDPTSVETIMDEPFSIGPRKTKAEENNFSGAALGLGVTHAGIGLGQWTNERGSALREYANSKNHDWFDMNVQLAYAISKDSGAPIFKEMLENKNEGSDNAQDAATFFLTKWERPADVAGNNPIRRKNASAWFAKMGGWEKDQDAADSILSMADTEAGVAKRRAEANALVKCSKNHASGGNSDAARAMATFAYSAYDKAGNNDGTYTYMWLRDEIFKGDVYYASCDRAVATAIRWSGTDDAVPVSGTTTQHQYYLSSDKWEEVKGAQSGGKPNLDVLKPGDVFVNNGNHTEMYVGKEAVKEVWGDKVPEEHFMGGASCNDHSPNMHAWDGGVAGVGQNGTEFKTFRIRKPEADSEFKELDPPSNHEPDTGPSGPTKTPGCG